METKILKLRESEASVSNGNADFKITLDRPIMMKEGDTLAIKSVFLDTITASGDMIEVDDDVKIELDVVKYVVNGSADQFFPTPNQTERLRNINPTGGGISTILTTGDAQRYFNCVTTNTSATTERAIKIKWNIKSRCIRKVGGLDLVFKYTNLQGKDAFFTHRVKRIDGTSYAPKGKEFDISITMAGKNMVCVNKSSQLESHWIDPVSIGVEYTSANIPNGQGACELKTTTFEYTLEKGTYTPAQLGELITDQMVLIDSSGPIGSDLPQNVYPINSPFLTTVCQLQHDDATSIFCNQDGERVLQYTQHANQRTRGEDRFIGANQVELNFNEDHKKLAFSLLHTPQYIGEVNPGSGNDAVPGIVYDTSKEVLKSYSGVAFTRMSPPEFWSTLGFTGVCVQSVSKTEVLSAGNGVNVSVIPVSVPNVEGVNVTAGFLSLDTPVQKNSNFRNPNATGSIQTNATVPIFGERIFSTDYSNEGYYYIELDCGIKQELVSSHGVTGFGSNKIHSIVGTYYSSNSFTSDTGQGSIAYTHKGLPQLISNVGVRILNANGKVPDPTLIGRHNCIFLEVVSQTK